MKRFSVTNLFAQKTAANNQSLFWLSGNQLKLVTDNKRSTHQLTADSGFSANKIADFSLALTTLKNLCQTSGLKFDNLWFRNKAIVFIPTDSSPLEKKLFKQLFNQLGFNQLELRKYETAFRAFLAKQDYEKGCFVYVGQEVSEIGVFASNYQQSFNIYYSLQEAIEETIYFFREKHLLELSNKGAYKLYQELGLQGEKFSLVVRGRNSRNKELQTASFMFKDVEPLYSFLQKKINQEIDSVRQNNLFKQFVPDKWVVLGDDFFQANLEKMGEKTLQLKSEFDLMQGIEWL